MGKIACGVAALCGLTFGGLLNILLLADAADDRLEAQGINTFFSAVKPPGETTGALMILYFRGCVVLLLVALIGAGPILVGRYRSGALRGGWWRLDSISLLLASIFLGALTVAVLNWWMMTGVYRDAAADGEWYSVSTVAIAVPAMRDFTLRYAGSLTALIFGSALVAFVARRGARPTLRRSP